MSFGNGKHPNKCYWECLKARPYPWGWSVWLPWLFHHPHSECHQRGGTGHLSPPPPRSSWRGPSPPRWTWSWRPAGCWCPKGRQPRSWGLWSGSTCVLGCDWKTRTRQLVSTFFFPNRQPEMHNLSPSKKSLMGTMSLFGVMVARFFWPLWLA